ncbi:LuxR family transcriptional regulator [Mycobacterium conspicuum]|nr:LuxR family transcriptional regulator [Mycobacterium conspicuum]
MDSVPNRPCVAVVAGEPGMGKTTLWLDALSRARERGFRVLASRAAAAESVLAYSALTDLLGSVDDATWADLPAPQRQGLDAALLRRRDDAHATDERAVAAAFVAVLEKLTAEGPVLIAIDDLQWLDSSSANVVSFAARRLPTGAALLCTTRTEEAVLRLQPPRPDAVQRILVQPFAIGELHQVLALRLGISIARPMLLRIHEISGGNPFFALELARDIDINRRPGELSLPGSLNELVSARIRQVAGGAEDALLAMACLPDPTVQMVAQASDTTPERLIELLGAAETEAVVAIDGNRIHFTHPILAHGVYSGAGPARRREVHRRLAELVTEPELRARHLALSDTTGEPSTIRALDTAAEITRSRGAPAAAAELLELAISLGGGEPDRRIRCAAYYFAASDPGRARQMLEAVVAELPAGPLRAEALHQLVVVRVSGDSFAQAASLLERGLAETGDDIALRVQMLITLSFARFNAGQLPDAVGSVDEAVTAAAGLEESNLLSQALGMRVMLRFLYGHGFDVDGMRRALELENREAPVPSVFRPSVQNGLLLACTGQLDTAHAEMGAMRRHYVDRGEESELLFIDFHSALLNVWRGEFSEAGSLADDLMERALQLGGDLPLCVGLTARALVAAYLGRVDEARSDVTDALAAGQRSNSRSLSQWPVTVLGFLDVSLGNYAAALATLQSEVSRIHAAPQGTEIIGASFVPDAVEAMIQLGRLDEAEPLIDTLERNGHRLDRPWMLAVGLRCRAMLHAARGDLDTATTTAEHAMAQHQRLPMPFERARTQLLLGQLQRRQRHRDTATTTLREAHRTFQQLGTTLWAQRATTELTRGTSGRRRAEGLTDSEQRVAELAVAGLTNRDIAATLFISPKTVEVNLSRIYRKLNVRSRIELYKALATAKE